MRITTYLKRFFIAGLSIFVLSGCSSGGSTATGLGLGVAGFWSGTLYRNGNPFTSFTMSLVQISDGGDDPFAPSTLEGTFNSNDKCIGGGTISGTLNANSITMAVEGPNGTLNMSGTASNSSMNGSWSNEGEIAGEEEGSSGTSCNFGGTWAAER